MSRATERLLWACLAALLVILACGGYCAVITACHWRGWSRAVDKTLVHVDQFAGRGARAMGKLEIAADETAKASKQEEAVIAHADALIQHAATLTDGATTLLADADAGVRAINGAAARLEPRMGHTADRLDAILDAYATIPPALNRALEPLPELQLSLARTSDATATFIGGPASTLAGNSATAVQHFDARWLAPYSGKHPRLHKVWTVTQGLVGFGARGAQGAYYLDQLH